MTWDRRWVARRHVSTIAGGFLCGKKTCYTCLIIPLWVDRHLGTYRW